MLQSEYTMASYNDEQIERMVRRLLARSRQRNERTSCPNEESVAEYLSGALTDQARSKLEEHFAGCFFCLNEIAAVSRAEHDSDTSVVPRWLMERAMGLVNPAATGRVVELVVKLVRDTVELVSSAREWKVPLTPQPVFARSRAAPTASSILQVERELDGHRVAVEVEQVESGICQVVVNVATVDGTPEDGVRLTLLSGEREQASYLTRQGQAVFECIAKGSYELGI